MVIFLSEINYTIFSAVFQVVMLTIGFMLYYYSNETVQTN